MIDNFPDEATMRERVHELMENSDTGWPIKIVEMILSTHGFNRIVSFSPNSSAITGHRSFDEAVLRTVYERDHGRVDNWGEEDALMFYLKYGYDLYP